MPFAVLLADGLCAACDRRRRMTEIQERQRAELHEKIVTEWVPQLERDLDLMVRFDEFLRRRS